MSSYIVDDRKFKVVQWSKKGQMNFIKKQMLALDTILFMKEIYDPLDGIFSILAPKPKYWWHKNQLQYECTFSIS